MTLLLTDTNEITNRLNLLETSKEFKKTIELCH